MIIAVDGPAASGKGTLAKRLAAHYGLDYLDTGRTYRAVAVELLLSGEGFSDAAAACRAAEAVNFDGLHDQKLSSAEVGEGASMIAVMPALREVLVRRQRAFAEDASANGAGAVLDGRDIATVVCPDAHVKLFVTASVEERARRRALELTGDADGDAAARIAEGLLVRDERDEHRAASPLRQAEGAVAIDTTDMSPDEALHAAIAVVDRAHHERR